MKIAVVLFALIFSLSACSIGAPIRLVDVKMAAAVDENLLPVNATDTFPSGTQKVSCWISWQDAKINTQVLASWHYLTDDIHILDYSFNIPKKDGAGSVALTMPNGKNLPPGSYKVDLYSGKRLLKSMRFTVR